MVKQKKRWEWNQVQFQMNHWQLRLPITNNQLDQDLRGKHTKKTQKIQFLFETQRNTKNPILIWNTHFSIPVRWAVDFYLCYKELYRIWTQRNRGRNSERERERKRERESATDRKNSMSQTCDLFSMLRQDRIRTHFATRKSLIPSDSLLVFSSEEEEKWEKEKEAKKKKRRGREYKREPRDQLRTGEKDLTILSLSLLFLSLSLLFLSLFFPTISSPFARVLFFPTLKFSLNVIVWSFEKKRKIEGTRHDFKSPLFNLKEGFEDDGIRIKWERKWERDEECEGEEEENDEEWAVVTSSLYLLLLPFWLSSDLYSLSPSSRSPLFFSSLPFSLSLSLSIHLSLSPLPTIPVWYYTPS